MLPSGANTPTQGDSASIPAAGVQGSNGERNDNRGKERVANLEDQRNRRIPSDRQRELARIRERSREADAPPRDSHRPALPADREADNVIDLLSSSDDDVISIEDNQSPSPPPQERESENTNNQMVVRPAPAAHADSASHHTSEEESEGEEDYEDNYDGYEEDEDDYVSYDPWLNPEMYVSHYPPVISTLDFMNWLRAFQMPREEEDEDEEDSSNEEEEESNSGSCIDILESSEDEIVDVTKDDKEEKEEKSPL